MCTVKTPKVQQPSQAVQKPVYMSNPYLDGLGINSEANGRNSLRIDLGSSVPHAPTPGTGGGLPGLPGGGIGMGNGGYRGRGGAGGLGMGLGDYGLGIGTPRVMVR